MHRQAPGSLLRGLLLLVLTLAIAPLRADDPLHKQALILHSYHPSFSWTLNLHRGIVRTLQAENPDLDICTEYLDWKRFPGEATLARFRTLLSEKYRARPFQVVFTTDNAATDFAVRHRELFPGAAIVFAGYNGYRPGIFPETTPVTGVAEVLDGAGTLDLALHFHPASRDILIICDATETGRLIRRELEDLLPHYGSRLRARFIGEDTTEAVTAEALAASPDTIILLALFTNDAKGRFLDLWELSRLFQRRGLTAPLYSFYEEAIGFGTVGGSLMAGERQGEAAARLGLRILRGEDVRRIPVINAPTVARVFDFRELTRFGVPPSRIPPDSRVLNQPPSFYARHRHLILGALGLSLALVVAQALLLIYRRQMERQVRASEARLRMLVQQMPVLTCALDAEDRILLWNRACELASGVPAAEVEGRPVSALFPEEAGGRTFVDLARGREVEAEVELALPAREGEPRLIRWFSEGHHSPIPGWAGWVVGVDVTERQKAEADRARLAFAVSQTVEAVLLASADGRINYANEAASSLFGLLPGALSRESLLAFLSIAEDQGLTDRIWEGLQRGQVWQGRLSSPRAGQPIVLEAALSPIRDVGGRFIGAAMVARDVTLQLKLEEQVRRSQRMDSLGSMASGIAHDFGNLLSSVVCSLDLVEEVGDPEKAREYLGTARSAACRAADLVRQLLSFARSKPQTLEPVDLHQLLEELHQIVRRTFPANVAIELARDASQPLVQGDGGQLLQVLMNLAINARDAMPAGGKLRFATRGYGGHLWLDVADTGIGMPPEVVARIFEPLFTTKDPGAGSGMGLAMVYSLVKSHGGTVEVESELGKGTTFHLCFPQARGEASPS